MFLERRLKGQDVWINVILMMLSRLPDPSIMVIKKPLSMLWIKMNRLHGFIIARMVQLSLSAMSTQSSDR